jgi:hypothetical protein
VNKNIIGTFSLGLTQQKKFSVKKKILIAIFKMLVLMPAHSARTELHNLLAKNILD